MEIATRRREQEVWQACDDLWALHGDMKNVTGDSIRERLIALGKSRGSPNEIYKYRKTWFTSRGLGMTSDDPMHDPKDCDPITRAVRLVHEQLKDSAESKIDALKQDFNQQIALKEQEIILARRSLESVLAEFALLEQKFSTATQDLHARNLQLAAEIDVRRALEKELTLQKSLLSAEQQHKELLVSELKSAHAQQVHQLGEHVDANAQRHEQQIKTMTEQLQNMGYDYSERLMEFKTKLLNQEIVAQQEQARLTTAQDIIAKLQHEIEMNKTMLAKSHEDHVHQNTTMAIKDAALQTEQERHRELRREFAQISRQLRKAERMLTRMRAMVTHRHRTTHAST